MDDRSPHIPGFTVSIKTGPPSEVFRAPGHDDRCRGCNAKLSAYNDDPYRCASCAPKGSPEADGRTLRAIDPRTGKPKTGTSRTKAARAPR